MDTGGTGAVGDSINDNSVAGVSRARGWGRCRGSGTTGGSSRHGVSKDRARWDGSSREIADNGPTIGRDTNRSHWGRGRRSRSRGLTGLIGLAGLAGTLLTNIAVLPLVAVQETILGIRQSEIGISGISDALEIVTIASIGGLTATATAVVVAAAAVAIAVVVAATVAATIAAVTTAAATRVGVARAARAGVVVEATRTGLVILVDSNGIGFQ